MNYTYSVKPTGERIYSSNAFINGYNLCEIKNGGCQVTIRDESGKTVQTFEKARSEQAGHRLAQWWIRNIRIAQLQRCK